ITIFSPPAERAADALFSAHMVQHLALLVVVPLLFLYGHTGRCMMMGLPRSWRRVSIPPRRLGGRAMSLLNWMPVVTVTFAAVLWAWHVPALYDVAVRNDFVHLTEHAMFLSVALLFWGNVLDRRRGFLRRSMLVFATAFHTGLLGAILVFAPAPLYSVHLHQTLLSITPLTDQELAGLIMWIPMGAVFMGTLAGLMLRGLGQSEVRQALDA
ncbi:MAG: cytochrome c oxidase assembly protein, partial [Acidimicrobiia bacterium]